MLSPKRLINISTRLHKDQLPSFRHHIDSTIFDVNTILSNEERSNS